jgi:hypothetical protein
MYYCTCITIILSAMTMSKEGVYQYQLRPRSPSSHSTIPTGSDTFSDIGPTKKCLPLSRPLVLVYFFFFFFLFESPSLVPLLQRRWLHPGAASTEILGDTWRKHAPGIFDGISPADQLHNPLDADTSRGPDWWFHDRDINEIKDSLELDIKMLNKRSKRSRRSLRSASIKAAVLKRQQQLTTGRMRQALASLLGKQRSSFLYDTLLCVDGSYAADPVEIHRRIQYSRTT